MVFPQELADEEVPVQAQNVCQSRMDLDVERLEGEGFTI
jgi:hypothetical protein